MAVDGSRSIPRKKKMSGRTDEFGNFRLLSVSFCLFFLRPELVKRKHKERNLSELCKNVHLSAFSHFLKVIQE